MLLGKLKESFVDSGIESLYLYISALWSWAGHRIGFSWRVNTEHSTLGKEQIDRLLRGAAVVLAAHCSTSECPTESILSPSSRAWPASGWSPSTGGMTSGPRSGFLPATESHWTRGMKALAQNDFIDQFSLRRNICLLYTTWHWSNNAAVENVVLMTTSERTNSNVLSLMY